MNPGIKLELFSLLCRTGPNALSFSVVPVTWTAVRMLLDELKTIALRKKIT
jgi:hypothetical protein